MAAEGNYIGSNLVDNWSDAGITEDADKQAVIDQVEQLVERITGDYFYCKSFDIKLDGNGKDRIFFSLRQDVFTITNLYVNEIEIARSEWDYDKDSVFLSLGFQETNQYELFPEGHNNIEIKGCLGWEKTPKAIIQACIILCRYENDNTLYTKYGFKSEKVGDWAYDRGTEKYLTGVLQADRLVRPYIRRKPMIGVA